MTRWGAGKHRKEEDQQRAKPSRLNFVAGVLAFTAVAGTAAGVVVSRHATSVPVVTPIAEPPLGTVRPEPTTTVPLPLPGLTPTVESVTTRVTSEAAPRTAVVTVKQVIRVPTVTVRITVKPVQAVIATPVMSVIPRVCR